GWLSLMFVFCRELFWEEGRAGWFGVEPLGTGDGPWSSRHDLLAWMCTRIRLSSRFPPPVTLGKPQPMAHSPTPPRHWRSWSGVCARPATDRLRSATEPVPVATVFTAPSPSWGKTAWWSDLR